MQDFAIPFFAILGLIVVAGALVTLLVLAVRAVFRAIGKWIRRLIREEIKAMTVECD